MADPFELLFLDYAKAFNEFDAEHIASFFHYPCFMTDAERVVPYSTREALVTNMQGLCAHHRSQGFGEATVVDLQVRRTAPNLAFVDVWWKVTHVDGSVLWEWSLTYSLANYADDPHDRLDNAGSIEQWKIVATTAHVDDPKA